MKKNTTKITTALLLIGTALLLCGCGAGQYGFSRYYVPLDEEKPYEAKSRVYTYGSVTARPHDFIDKWIGWFGIVEKAAATEDGRHLVRLAFHTHKERHLCESEVSSSCRVTVNFKSTGGFSALLSLRGEDLVPGLDKVQPGTLMRVFGKVRCQKTPDDEYQCDHDEKGGVLLDVEYYRQWPARYYRTTRRAGQMRR
jgi:hypothetical protein